MKTFKELNIEFQEAIIECRLHTCNTCKFWLGDSLDNFIIKDEFDNPRQCKYFIGGHCAGRWKAEDIEKAIKNYLIRELNK